MPSAKLLSYASPCLYAYLCPSAPSAMHAPSHAPVIPITDASSDEEEEEDASEEDVASSDDERPKKAPAR